MTYIAPGPNGETCTDHGMPWIKFPLNPNTGPFIPGLQSTESSSNTATIGNDLAVALAKMPSEERRQTIDRFIEAGTETRGIRLAKKQASDMSEKLAEFLDEDKLKTIAGIKWPPGVNLDVKLNYDFNKNPYMTVGISIKLWP